MRLFALAAVVLALSACGSGGEASRSPVASSSSSTGGGVTTTPGELVAKSGLTDCDTDYTVTMQGTKSQHCFADHQSDVTFYTGTTEQLVDVTRVNSGSWMFEGDGFMVLGNDDGVMRSLAKKFGAELRQLP